MINLGDTRNGHVSVCICPSDPTEDNCTDNIAAPIGDHYVLPVPDTRKDLPDVSCHNLMIGEGLTVAEPARLVSILPFPFEIVGTESNLY